MPVIRPQLYYKYVIRSFTRTYATIDTATIVARPPRPPVPVVEPIEQHVLAALGTSSPNQPDLPDLIDQYLNRSGHVLDYSLPYELFPAASRRTNFDAAAEESAVSMIAHCVRDGDKHKVILSSGFALQGPGHRQGESLMLTCAHTLEEASCVPYVYVC